MNLPGIGGSFGLGGGSSGDNRLERLERSIQRMGDVDDRRNEVQRLVSESLASTGVGLGIGMYGNKKSSLLGSMMGQGSRNRPLSLGGLGGGGGGGLGGLRGGLLAGGGGGGGGDYDYDDDDSDHDHDHDYDEYDFHNHDHSGDHNHHYMAHELDDLRHLHEETLQKQGALAANGASLAAQKAVLSSGGSLKDALNAGIQAGLGAANPAGG